MSAGEDGSVRLWDAARRRRGPGPAQRRGAERGRRVQPRRDPDPRRRRRRLDQAVGRRQRRGASAASTARDGSSTAVAFSADGRRFAAGGRDGVTRVWSVAGGPPVAVLRGQRSRVYDVGFGRTSDRVVSAGDDGTVRIWDAGRDAGLDRPEPDLRHRLQPRRQAHRDQQRGRHRAGLGRGHGTAGRRACPARTAHGGQVLADRRHARRHRRRARVRIWPVAAARADVVVRPTRTAIESAAEFDATGERIVVRRRRGRSSCATWRPAARSSSAARAEDPSGAPAFSPDGKHVAAFPTGDVLVWRIDRPARRSTCSRGTRGRCNSVDYSPDGGSRPPAPTGRSASGSRDGGDAVIAATRTR